jgi:pyrroloquinoline-quinone synthase
MPIDIEQITKGCDEIVAKYNLLTHSFYQRWTDGTLPIEALRSYSSEYGAFVHEIGRGWDAIGKADMGRVEDGHARLWDRTFAAGLDAPESKASVPEVTELIETSRRLFETRSTTLGALYAIEAQQPIVAEAKLKGLEQHYSELPSQCGDYFRVHSDDYDELQMITSEMEGLNASEEEAILQGCEMMARAQYNALTGIEAPFLGKDRCVAA